MGVSSVWDRPQNTCVWFLCEYSKEGHCDPNVFFNYSFIRTKNFKPECSSNTVNHAANSCKLIEPVPGTTVVILRPVTGTDREIFLEKTNNGRIFNEKLR